MEEGRVMHYTRVILTTFGRRPVFPGSGKNQRLSAAGSESSRRRVGHRRDAVTFTPLQLR